MIYGVILLIVILKFPGGLYPYLLKLKEFLLKKFRKPAAAEGKG